MYIKQIQK